MAEFFLLSLMTRLLCRSAYYLPRFFPDCLSFCSGKMSRLLTAEFEHLSCFRYRRAEALVGTKELQSLAFELSSFDVAHQKALASFAGAS